MRQLAFLLLFAMNLFADPTFTVELEDTSRIIEPGNSCVFEGYLHNTGSAGTVVQVTRLTNELPEGWSTSICLGETCYPPFTDQVTAGIEAGDSLFFDITFNTSDAAGQGQALLLFEDIVFGEKDSVLFSVETKSPPAFSISWHDTLAEGIAGSSFPLDAYIHNLSDKPIVIQANRMTNELPDGWTSTLCLGATCYAPGISEINALIQPADSLLFDITFNTSEEAGSGQALIQFSDAESGQLMDKTFAVETRSNDPSFYVTFNDTVISGTAGSELVMDGFIHNLADSIITANIVRLTNDIPSGWTSALCFDFCYAPFVDTISTQIAAGDSLEYSIHFFSDSLAASGQAMLAFTAAGSPGRIEKTFAAQTEATAIDSDNLQLSRSFQLSGNYPNPFNNATTIRFTAPEAAISAELSVFNTAGQELHKRALNGVYGGEQRFNFDASPLSSGVYIYRLTLTGISGKRYVAARKFTLLK